MTTTPDPYLTQDIERIMTEVPPPVKEIFAKDKIQVFVKHITPVYKLTSFQASLLTREIALLVLLLATLEDFKNILILEAGLSKETTDQVYKELERKILKPLQGVLLEMPVQIQTNRAKNENVSEPKKVAVQVPLPSYAGAPPPQSPRYVRPEPKVPEVYSAPIQAKTGTARPAVTLGMDGAPVGQQPLRPAAPMSVPQSPPPSTPTFAPASAQSIPQAVPVVAPQAALPQGEDAGPGSTPPVEPPPFTKTVSPQAPVAAPAAAKAGAPVPAPRPTDPYREPIDEKTPA